MTATWWAPFHRRLHRPALGPYTSIVPCEPSEAHVLRPVHRPAELMTWGRGWYARHDQLHHFTALTWPG